MCSTNHIDPNLAQRLSLPKFLLREANRVLERPGPYSNGLATSILQDATESFLRTVAIQCRVSISPKQSFSEVLGKVAHEIQSVAEHKVVLTRLNNARVMFKHDGLSASERREVIAFAANVESFLTEVSAAELNVDFTTVSLAGAISHRRTENWIEKAEKALDARDFEGAVQNTSGAMAIYLSHHTRHDPEFRKSWTRSPLQKFRTSGADLLHQQIFEGNSPNLQLLTDLADFANWAQDQIERTTKRTLLMARGVDVSAHEKFNAIAPQAFVMGNGHVRFIATSPDSSTTAENARFSIDIVVDTALALRSNRPPETYPRRESSAKVIVTRTCDVIVHPSVSPPEVIREVSEGEILDVSKENETGLKHEYFRILQDGDDAYVSSECVEIHTNKVQ